VASINYTVSGTTKFPQQIYDVNAAIRFLRANAGKYRLNGKIGLWARPRVVSSSRSPAPPAA
jgi:acetyl esterase/lipase